MPRLLGIYLNAPFADGGKELHHNKKTPVEIYLN